MTLKKPDKLLAVFVHPKIIIHGVANKDILSTRKRFESNNLVNN